METSTQSQEILGLVEKKIVEHQGNAELVEVLTEIAERIKAIIKAVDSGWY